MANEITLRVAGSYTVTTDGGSYLVNGQPARIKSAPKNDRGFVALVETGVIAANGKMDCVGLTQKHIDMKIALQKMVSATPCASAETTRVAAERAFDMANNEGGDGYNPHRHGAGRTYAPARNVDRSYPRGA